MLTNWLSQVGNLKGDERKLIHDFIRRKGGSMMWEKNKSNTPSLAFPFSLNLNKTCSFSKKEDMCFGGFGIKNKC